MVSGLKMESRKVNLGCGRSKLNGYINVDFDPSCSPDILHDLNKGLPFDSNSVDEIVADDFLEHCKDFVSMMNEIARVLKVGGKLRARFPPWNSEGAFTSNHTRVVVYQDFRCFEPGQCKNFVYSINGERLNKCFKVLTAETLKGKCPYCPERRRHKLPKCHVVLEKIK